MKNDHSEEQITLEKERTALYNHSMKKVIHPPRHLVWSTNQIDSSDPFQRRWLLQQTLIYGTADDIRRLDIDEVAENIDHLHLPPHIERLWRSFLKNRNG
jgi:DNA topoisomerase IB